MPEFTSALVVHLDEHSREVFDRYLAWSGMTSKEATHHIFTGFLTWWDRIEDL